MSRTSLRVLAVAVALSPAALLSQSSGALHKAIYIMKSDYEGVLQKDPKGVDHQLRVVDMGKYNLAIGIIHRGPTKDDQPVGGIAHDATTETYVVVSGSGTLVTGGTIENGRRSPADSEVTKVLNGPSTSGPMKDYDSRVVNPGDVILIPAGVPHGWTKIADHVDYLSVRPDPDKVLPAGYVNPSLTGH